jgi:hypothetical protein
MQTDYRVAAPPARHVLLHFHLFKNGGSTMEAILAREFRGHYATVHGSHAGSSLDAFDIEAFVNNHPEMEAVSSHHLRYPLPSIRRTVLFDCCFLRHPLDRLQSVYSYLRAEPAELGAEDPILVLAQAVRPREFMLRMMDESPHFVHNAQTLLVAAGGAFTRPMDADDLARAMESVRRMALPGVVELFDESLIAAEHFLGPAFPRLRLHYVAQNVTRPVRALGERLEELKTLWGADVYRELAELNRLDLELWQRAKEEVLRRFALVPRTEERLAEFRSRCSRLQLQAAS